MADARPAQTTAPLERFVPALLALLVLIQVGVLWHFMGAVAGAADSSGYMNSARLLARGEFSTPIRPVPGITTEALPGYVDELYAPLGFRPIRRNGTISPIYPIGLPLLVVGAAKIMGWSHAPGIVLGIHAVLGVLLMYALGREFGLPPGWSLLGSLLLGVSPLFSHMALWTMSDVPALGWTTAGLLAAWRARRNARWALAAGFAVGFAVLVRPTSVLIFLPAIIALGFGAKRALLFTVGGLPAAAALAGYNFKAYGSVFTSGYFNPPDTFALHHAATTLVHYALWLPVLLTPLVLAALALPWARSVGGREKAVLATWIAVVLGFYALYSFTHETWWFLRFLLPAFPPLIVASLLTLRNYTGRKRRGISPAVAWTAVAAAIVLNGGLWTRRLHALDIGRDELAYKTTAAWVRNHMPASAIVMAMQNSGALHYYTDFQLVRSDWLKPEQFHRAVSALRSAGRPIYAVLQDFEQEDLFGRHIPGHWIKVERVLNSPVWRLEP